MRVPSPSDRIYACARQFTMNLRYAFNNCAFARVRTYVLSTQLGVLHDQLRVLSVRKCGDFHENRLIYAYLSTRVAKLLANGCFGAKAFNTTHELLKLLFLIA